MSRPEEGEHATPRVVAGSLVIGERAVEERVWRAGVHLEMMLDAAFAERRVERVDVAVRDARIRATHQAEHRRAHSRRFLDRDRPRLAFAFGEPAVEAHDAGDPWLLRRGEERDPAAEAEPEDESTPRTGLVLDGCDQ